MYHSNNVVSNNVIFKLHNTQITKCLNCVLLKDVFINYVSAYDTIQHYQGFEIDVNFKHEFKKRTFKILHLLFYTFFNSYPELRNFKAFI